VGFLHRFGLVAVLSRTWRIVVIVDLQARIGCMTCYHHEIISACNRAFAQVGGQVMLHCAPAGAEVESLTHVGGTEQARHTLAGVRHQLHSTSPRLPHGEVHAAARLHVLHTMRQHPRVFSVNVQGRDSFAALVLISLLL